MTEVYSFHYIQKFHSVVQECKLTHLYAIGI